MALLHPKSNGCINSELDLFQIPLTQTGIMSGEWVEYNIVSSISNNSVLTFCISGNSETYVDLSQTLLHVQVEITKLGGGLPKAAVYDDDGKLVTPADKLAPVNLFLHSLFPEVHLFLNEKSVTPSAQNYPYKSMFQTMLTFGAPAKDSHLTSSLFYRDTPGVIDDMDKNEGFKKRGEFAQKGLIDMIGVVHLDLCQQSRFLLNLVDLKFVFGKPNPEFCIHGVGKGKVDIKSASLYLRKVKLIPEIPLSHAKALQFTTAKYPITRTECISFSIPSGNMSAVQDHLFTGQIPKKVVIGLVSQSAFLGDITLSPYNFQHFNLNHIGLYVDGNSVPHKPLTPNITENDYIRAYANLFLQTGQFNIDEGNQISREDFVGGNFLLAYDLTADLVSNANHFHLIKNGNLRLELRFAEALKETIAVIVYGEFQGLIEIDKNRTVIFDY